MPIKPENKQLYPENWPEIRERIRQRAGDKCEVCKVPNHSFICRGKWNGKEVYQDDDGNIYLTADGTRIGENYVGDLEGDVHFLEVICTTAHKDHDPSNNEDDNLAFWCQLHHNRYDRQHRNQTIKNNKLKGQLKLL